MPQTGSHTDLRYCPDVLNKKKKLAALIGEKKNTALVVIHLLV